MLGLAILIVGIILVGLFVIVVIDASIDVLLEEHPFLGFLVSIVFFILAVWACLELFV